METKWFDDLTRAIAPPVSRRRSLKILGGSLASRLLTLLGISLGVVPSRASADERLTDPDVMSNTSELLPYQDTGYRFKTLPLGAAPPSGWEQPGFDESGFQLGRGAFGSGGDCPLQSTVQTNWPINSQLLVRTVATVPPGATNLRIMVSVDNDINGVFFDGQALTSTLITHEECPIKDEFRFDVPSSLAEPGNKLLAFHVQDRGVESFFDARILAELPLFATTSFCSTTNVVTVPCTELLDYQKFCGVICPDGVRLYGKSGCTSFDSIYFERHFQPPVRFHEDFLGETCASLVINGQFILNNLKADVIDWRPNACCTATCESQVIEFRRQLEEHEGFHLRHCEDVVQRFNLKWIQPQTLTGCGENRRNASIQLGLVIDSNIQADQEAIYRECNSETGNIQIKQPDCTKCIPASSSRRCVNGVCMEGTCRQSTRCPTPSTNVTECRCTTVADCSRRGKACLCVSTVEGDIRCGTSFEIVGGKTCPPPCSKSTECEARYGQGFFCAEAFTNCCPDRTCLPPC